MIKLNCETVFYYLFRTILPLFIINWPLFFEMGKKSQFFIKKFISIFPGQCPQCATMSLMCNTFLGSLGVAHWVHPVYTIFWLKVNDLFKYKIHRFWNYNTIISLKTFDHSTESIRSKRLIISHRQAKTIRSSTESIRSWYFLWINEKASN